MIKMICPDCGAEQGVGETFYEWVPTGEVLCENCITDRIQSMSVQDYWNMSGADKYERDEEGVI